MRGNGLPECADHDRRPCDLSAEPVVADPRIAGAAVSPFAVVASLAVSDLVAAVSIPAFGAPALVWLIVVLLAADPSAVSLAAVAASPRAGPVFVVALAAVSVSPPASP